jgi:tetratricopeptide (TPR) repeat protein
VKYCVECGFKLEGEFKFCPNCGNPISTSEDILQNERLVESKKVVVCKNCGEENPIENSVCFSCGILLKDKKSFSSEKQPKRNLQKDSTPEKGNSKKNIIDEEKVLDNKKILIISSVIVLIFIIALIASGVFDSGIQRSVTQMNNQSENSGVNMANMQEINDLENKVASNPEDMESTLHLAHLLQDSGFFEKAITNYRKFLEKNQENADVRVDMAICYYNINDYNTAIAEMEAALKYQPKHQIAHLNLGIVNLTAKNLAASKEWFQKTVDIDPNSEAGKRAQELLTSH